MNPNYSHSNSTLFGDNLPDYESISEPGYNTPEHSIPEFNQMALIKTLVLSGMFLVSFIGNLLTLLQMLRIRRRKSTINTLIMHLAIADLFVTFFCNVTDAVWASTVQWYAGNELCKVLKYLQVFSLYLSTYIIVIIALDRCMAILDPMGRNKAPRRVKIMIISAWIFSATVSLPQVRTPLPLCFPPSILSLARPISLSHPRFLPPHIVNR